MPASIDINKLHREYWEKRLANISALLAKPRLVATVAKREVKKAHFVKLALSDAVRIERIRNQRPFELELEAAAEELSGLPINEAQRRRARMPRGKVMDDGRTLNQAIETLIGRPENRFSSTSEVWPQLFAALDQELLEPKEKFHKTDFKKSAYEYDFKGARKTITYGRFASLVSRYRKKSR